VPGRVHTIEASPDSLGPEHLDVLLEHGVRRVSMGIESLDESVLDTVRRRHTAAQALAACRLVLDRGLTLNVDLIYGLPGQTEEGFRRDLDRAAAAGVSSLCLYALRLNANTAVANVVEAGERFDLERLVRWRRFVFRAAEEAGFVRTRPYFFERPGPSSLPSQSPDEPLLGIGMSARSQIGDTVFRNLDRSAGYLERIEGGESPVETVFRMGEGDRQALFLAGGLGNGRALSRAAWSRRFARVIDDDHGERLGALRDGGLLVDDGDSLRLSEDGLAVYDRVVLGFYPEVRAAALRELPPPRAPRSAGRST
jgi:oxygen-independent coproporphyrinogen-3 oxidase